MKEIKEAMENTVWTYCIYPCESVVITTLAVTRFVYS